MTAVLHVISGLGMGGAERNLAQLAGGLQGRGVAQHVACVNELDVWADRLVAQGVGVTMLGVTSVLGAPLGLMRLASLVRELRPAVVQGWMYHGDLFSALSHRLTPGRKQRRLFWNLRASNSELHGCMVALNARLSSWPDLIIANSNAGLDFHVANGYRPRRAEVIANGIDTDAFRPDARARSEVRSELGIPHAALVAIHVARVDAMKDHATFLTAMRALPMVLGLLVGMGTDALSTPENVRALGLRFDVARLYAAADIVVSTSAFAEGFSNALAEGMSSGLIPIATDVGDARLIVGETGQVVPKRDPNAFAQALRSVADLPAAQRQARGQQARTRIVANFALASVIDRYARLYAAA